jgi:4-amino-4-deoxy-L-arabinose transferase-like glycosyltransferase
MSTLSTPKEVGRLDHLFGAGLAFFYLLVLLATASDIGMSRDESFYVTAADDYGRWFEQLVDDPGAALTRESVDRHWSYNSEHPPLMKALFAWSALFDRKLYPKLREGMGLSPGPFFSEPSTAYRLPGMLTAALTLWLIYVIGARAAGRRVGVFAALAYATLPRVFYHAHLDCFDVPIVLMMTWTTYAYWRALESRRWALFCGFAFGCALATKHNSWVLPGIFAIHFAWVVVHELARRRAGEAKVLRLFPYWLVSMLTVGPLVFFVSWPHIWFDTFDRLRAYAAFHVHHEYYNMAYFGLNYFRPPFPVSYPFVMTLFTIPFTLSLLGVAGIALRARALLPLWLSARIWKRGALAPDARCTDVLWFGCLLAPLIIIALPSTPIFGGTKHWFSAYPFLCLFAGYAALHVVVSLESRLLSRGMSDPGRVALSCLGVLLAPGVAETAHSHPFGLSHYTLPAGGVPGAADLGMNRQFWGFTTRSVVDYLREKLPQGGTVFILDTTVGAFEMLKRDGHLPDNIHASGSLSEADYVLVQHEHHMAEVDFQAWQLFGSVQPSHVLTYDGVPIISIYEHPRRRPPR